MSNFKIKVKDVKEFIKMQCYVYASGQNKKFFIALRSGPNVERYFVEDSTGRHTGFIKLGEAVKFFNAS